MATEHTLRIKAVLDDSEVKRQLAQLRKQARAVSSANSKSGGSIPQLAQLTTAINRLSQQISRLNISQNAVKVMSDFGRGNFSKPSLFMPPILSMRAAQKQYSGLPVNEKRRIANNIISPAAASKLFDEAGLTPLERFVLHLRFGGGAGENVALANILAKKDFIDKKLRSNPLVQKFKQENERYMNNRNRNRQFGTDLRQMKSLSYVAGGFFADTLQELMPDSPAGKVSSGVLHGVTSGLQSAASMSWLGFGNPVSLAVGSMLGLGIAAKNASVALKDIAETRAKQQQHLDEVQADADVVIQQLSLRRRLPNLGREELEEELGKWRLEAKTYGSEEEIWKRFKERQRAYSEDEFAIGDGNLRVYRKLTLDEQLKYTAESAKLRDKELKSYAIAANSVQNLERRLVELDDTSFLDDMLEKWRNAVQVMDLKQRLNANDQTEEENRGLSKHYQDILDSKLLPIQKFQQIQQTLQDFRSTVNEVKATISSLDAQINSVNPMDDFALETLHALQQQRSYHLERLAMYEARMDIGSQALGQIHQNLIRPDFSPVTSLAQYGYNMGERPQNEQLDKVYWERSINLQRDIKNEIQLNTKALGAVSTWQ